jgi:23S rRNA (cytosine1962-C5)-methyltransferase
MDTCYNEAMSFTPANWMDYELIDVGEGEKLERYGAFVLRRPDSNALAYVTDLKSPLWKQADAVYRQNEKIGEWVFKRTLPESWNITYNDLTFKIAPTQYKHTGLFPEQATNWDFMRTLITQSKREIKVLNLFAYTGAASISCAKAGASVVHVDASKGMVQWAKENAVLSGLGEAKIRYIVDDVMKFVQREIRRGNHYDGIIMDPPSFGRGPKGELWKFNEKLSELIELSKQLLSEKPLFFVVSTYSASFDLSDLKKLMHESFPIERGETQCAELILPIANKSIPLDCGYSARVIFK